MQILLVKDFEDYNIEIYGTYENPLFKASDTANMLEIKKIRSTLDNMDDNCKVFIHEQYFLTEFGLYELILMSRKPFAKKFKLWVFEVLKEIRTQQLHEKDKKLEEANTQLNVLKTRKYEECDINGIIYVIETDGGMKIGHTKYNSHKRIKGLQTGNVNDIKTLYEQECHEPSLTESLIHKILKRYRCKKNREFFDVNLDYIILVVKYVISTLDTIFSTYDKITQDELFEKLAEKYSSNGPLKIVETTVTTTVKTVSYEQGNKEYMDWIKKGHLVKEEGCKLSLGEICDKFKQIMSKNEKTNMKRYIEKEFSVKCIRIKNEGKACWGFKGLTFTNN
jgi:prophage antirepressor-like protein